MNSSSSLTWRWKQMPVHFHWSVILWLPWYYFQTHRLLPAIECALATLLILVLHEGGHALMARLRHTQVFAIRIFFLLGRCEHAHPRYERDDIYIAWGGVLAQAALLVLAVGLEALLEATAPEAHLVLGPVFSTLIWTNAFWIAFNLVPAPSLDGHTAWRIVPLWLGPQRWARLSQGMKSFWPSFDSLRRRKAEKASSKVTYELLERLRQPRKQSDSKTDTKH